MDAVGGCTMDLLDGWYFVIEDLVFTLVFLLFVFVDAMGSSSDITSLASRILIKQSMFCRVLLCVVTTYSLDWSILKMVVVHGGLLVLCCEWFRLCRYNLGGDEKGWVGGKFFG
jgi:hypothetical protein